jgi:hypothetical protein
MPLEKSHSGIRSSCLLVLLIGSLSDSSSLPEFLLDGDCGAGIDSWSLLGGSIAIGEEQLCPFQAQMG